MANVVVERRLRCASERQAIWPYISDTERLNRAIGFTPIEVTAHDDDSAARFTVRTKTAGFPIMYEELPFEWAENRFYRVLRIVREGAAERVDNLFTLEALPEGGCALHMRIEIKPRYRLLAPIIRLQTSRFADRVIQELARIDKALQADGGAAFALSTPPVNQRLLRQLGARLQQSVTPKRKDIAKKLMQWLQTSSDAEVSRIRPLELAAGWQRDGRAVLSTCLSAVDNGLLRMRWDLVCPSCQTASDHVTTLAELTDRSHCQMCDIDFEVDFDLAVEATFRPAQAIRQVDERPYCIGGPAITPHVLAQAILPAGGETSLIVPERTGPFRLFVRGGQSVPLTVNEQGAASARIDASSRDQALPGSLHLAPGAEIVVHQSDARDRHVKIEQTRWRRLAATARLIATLPEFRRRFSHDVLRPGMAMSIGNAALLFTDLTASTALYRSMGDATAFAIVDASFTMSTQLIEQHQGVVIKTMGDAVMAAFTTMENAVQAAHSLHQAMPAFRTQHQGAGACHLKIGIAEGPCYAVTANGILDYFGQTVNIAARLQHEAQAGEIVLLAEVMEQARTQGWLPADIATRSFEAHLKGVGDTLLSSLRLD